MTAVAAYMIMGMHYRLFLIFGRSCSDTMDFDKPA
jgi:hypothetical protein